MKIHRERIAGELSRCCPKGQAMFAFLCAERLRGCCWALQAGFGVDLSAFFKWSDELFELLTSHGSPDPALVKEGRVELESIVPESGAPLSVQAQCAVICLISAFEILAGGTSPNIIDSVNAMIDALHNYDYSVRSRIKNDHSSSTDYPLLQRELSRQVIDSEFVKRYNQLDRSLLIERRIENLQFAVPVAI